MFDKRYQVSVTIFLNCENFLNCADAAMPNKIYIMYLTLLLII